MRIGVLIINIDIQQTTLDTTETQAIITSLFDANLQDEDPKMNSTNCVSA